MVLAGVEWACGNAKGVRETGDTERGVGNGAVFESDNKFLHEEKRTSLDCFTP
jgi:hypothetical protein